MADLKMNVANCVAKLTEAQAEFSKAEAANKVTERELTQCRNTLNEAQKTVDEAMAELKKSAPWNTAWSQPAMRGERVNT